MQQTTPSVIPGVPPKRHNPLQSLAMKMRDNGYTVEQIAGALRVRRSTARMFVRNGSIERDMQRIWG